jgi:hypothetical protein
MMAKGGPSGGVNAPRLQPGIGPALTHDHPHKRSHRLTSQGLNVRNRLPAGQAPVGEIIPVHRATSSRNHVAASSRFGRATSSESATN